MRQRRTALSNLTAFLLVYLSTLLVTVILIANLPKLGLLLFLLLSAHHFGQSHQEHLSPQLRMSFFGAVVVCLLVTAHPNRERGELNCEANEDAGLEPC